MTKTRSGPFHYDVAKKKKKKKNRLNFFFTYFSGVLVYQWNPY